jgi:hypothetical protein
VNCPKDGAALGGKLASLVHRPPLLSFSGSVSHQFNTPGVWTATALQNGTDPILSVTITITGSNANGHPAAVSPAAVAPNSVLIPVTGIDPALWRTFASRLFLYFGLGVLGAGLVFHALSGREVLAF